MKKQMVFLLLAVFIVSLACQALTPNSRDGTVIPACPDIVTSVRNIQPTHIPQTLLETGIKHGDEFDVRDYFMVLTSISMQDGYLLDYVYQVDGLGAYPILYARPVDQPAYISTKDLPADFDAKDYINHISIENTEQGYFELAIMNVMARQFYLDWHANYNDTEIVCNADAVDAIISDINSSDFGAPFGMSQRAKARAMENIEPLVKLTDDTAQVDVTVFTKWGGFYRWTYTISRSFPHTIIDVKQENLVPYDCGIMF